MFEHDYNAFPELSNRQLEDFGFTSPHKQYTEDFRATVVKVHDGDTITLRTTDRDFNFPLRFLNINSKELNQGGEEAREWLKGKIEGKTVDIKIDKNNRVGAYGRLLGTIIFNGIDIGQEELYLGLALPFGQEHEQEIPNQEKIFNIKQWQ